MLYKLLREKTIESKLINIKTKSPSLIKFSYIIIIIMVGETKIENVIDNKLNDFFFPFISNKLIFILLVIVYIFK